MLSISLSIPTTAIADCPERLLQCDALVGLCTRALDAREEQIKVCELAIEQHTEHNALLNTRITQLEADKNAWFRNPFIIGAIGIAAGSLAATYIVLSVK